MSLLFNMLSRLVITFLPRSKHFLISWLQSPSAVILEPPKIKSVTVSPSICHEMMGPDAMILVFWKLSFKPTFSFSSFTFFKRLFTYSSLSAMRVVSSAYLRLLLFLPAILIPACASSTGSAQRQASFFIRREDEDWDLKHHVSFQHFLKWKMFMLSNSDLQHEQEGRKRSERSD